MAKRRMEQSSPNMILESLHYSVQHKTWILLIMLHSIYHLKDKERHSIFTLIVGRLLGFKLWTKHLLASWGRSLPCIWPNTYSILEQHTQRAHNGLFGFSMTLALLLTLMFWALCFGIVLPTTGEVWIDFTTFFTKGLMRGDINPRAACRLLIFCFSDGANDGVASSSEATEKLQRCPSSCS